MNFNKKHINGSKYLENIFLSINALCVKRNKKNYDFRFPIILLWDFHCS